MKAQWKQVAVLLALGLLLGMFLAAWVILGDQLYYQHGKLVLLASLVFHVGVLPIAFAYVGARGWRNHPFLAGWIVCAIPAIGGALAASAIYIMTPKGEFNVSATSNNWRDASLGEFVRLAIQSMPEVFMVLAWIFVVGAIGAALALVHRKLKADVLLEEEPLPLRDESVIDG